MLGGEEEVPPATGLLEDEIVDAVRVMEGAVTVTLLREVDTQPSRSP